MHKVIAFLLLIGVLGQSGLGQEVRERTDGFLREVFQVANSDTALKDGPYNLFYKGEILEKGHYCKGHKCGKWQYFSFGSFFEYEYDYDADSLTRMVPHEDASYPPGDHPCLFNGSPFIPYLFIVNNVFFTEEANSQGLAGKTVLTLEIDSEGIITDRYISQSNLDIFARVVLEASQKFPSDWRWLPARKKGVNVADKFEMAIIFEQ